MDHPIPLFDKEQQVAANARLALAGSDGSPLAGPFKDLLEQYEELLERSRGVAEMALSVQLDLESAMDQVAQLSQVDGLTGCLNRRAFERLLARDWAQAQREGSDICLIIVNVDLFRAFNDIYGSLAGDDCLKDVARTMMRCVYREVDAVARLEADTFAALLPGTDAQGGLIVANRILIETASLMIPHLESPHGGSVTVCCGLAAIRPTRADAPMALVRQAQSALGEAKDSGRNSVALFNSSSNEAA